MDRAGDGDGCVPYGKVKVLSKAIQSVCKLFDQFAFRVHPDGLVNSAYAVST